MTRAQLWRAFFAKVRISDEPGACWPYTGLLDRDGYGRFGDKRANRLVWELVWDMEMPPELEACHRCDNPPCSKPAHIYAGTRKENRADRVAREAAGLPKNVGPSVDLGEVLLPAEPTFTAEEVAARVEAGESLRDLALEYEAPVSALLSAMRSL